MHDSSWRTSNIQIFRDHIWTLQIWNARPWIQSSWGITTNTTRVGNNRVPHVVPILKQNDDNIFCLTMTVVRTHPRHNESSWSISIDPKYWSQETIGIDFYSIHIKLYPNPKQNHKRNGDIVENNVRDIRSFSILVFTEQWCETFSKKTNIFSQLGIDFNNPFDKPHKTNINIHIYIYIYIYITMYSV